VFNLQGSEIVIILLLALVVLGPEKLPEAMRRAGKFYADLRKMSSGFQDEFRAAVDEPMREIRDTANVLRDSADFTSLKDGEREEKPKSAEMAPVDPDIEPTDDTPTFDTPGPTTTADSKPAPFEGESSAAPAPTPDEVRPESDEAPKPFSGNFSAAPPLSSDDGATEPLDPPKPFSYPRASVPPPPSDDSTVDSQNDEPTQPGGGESSAAPSDEIHDRADTDDSMHGGEGDQVEPNA